MGVVTVLETTLSVDVGLDLVSARMALVQNSTDALIDVLVSHKSIDDNTKFA